MFNDVMNLYAPRYRALDYTVLSGLTSGSGMRTTIVMVSVAVCSASVARLLTNSRFSDPNMRKFEYSSYIVLIISRVCYG